MPTTTTLESLIGEDDVASGAVKVTADSDGGPLPQGADASSGATAADEFTDQRDDDAEQVPSITTTTNDLFWETTTQTMLVLTDSTGDDQELERYNIELSSA